MNQPIEKIKVPKVLKPTNKKALFWNFGDWILIISSPMFPPSLSTIAAQLGKIETELILNKGNS